MNSIDNLDYTINATVKDNKIQIEYKGRVFKENPSLITKDTSKLKFMETEEGFITELTMQKGTNLNFSISNINNPQILNKKNNRYENELLKITDLTVIEKMSIWEKIVNYIKKITTKNLQELQTQNITNNKSKCIK